MLGRKIQNIDLDVNKRMLGDRKDSKIARLDIRATFNNGEDCDIELQVQPYKYMDKRMLEYWGSMYISKIKRGKEYNILKPSIVILIADYKLENLKEVKKYHTKWNLREEEYQDLILTNEIELHILELPKIKDINIKKDELALWLKFIQDPSNEEVKMEEDENPVLKQAMKELAHLSGTPGFRRIVEAREGFIRDQNTEKAVARREGIEEGVKRGKKEGKNEKAIEIAKKLLLKNMNTKEISEITGLSIEEIEKLEK